MAASGAASLQSETMSEPVDLAATPQSLARAVIARRPEYVRPHRTRVKIGTWNVAACPGTDKDLESWFVGGRGLDQSLAALDLSHNPAVKHAESRNDDSETDSVRLVGGSDIGLYVLGLQEIVDLNATKDYVNRAVYADSAPKTKWMAAIEAAMPPGYELVASEQMTGLLLLIYASPEIAPTISNVSTKPVGTGLWGYLGNKGAVTTRLVLGETTRMVFVNCHLASGAAPTNLNRRCWDVSQILAKTQFEPVVHAGVAEDDGEKIGDEDFAFWFGDLNFRMEGLPGDDIRRILTLHARGEYGADDAKSRVPIEGGDGVIVMRNSESDDDTTTLSSTHSQVPSLESDSSLPDPDDFPEDPSQDPTSLQATLDSLLPHDQLKRVMKERKVFHDGWREGPVTFLPSYKYDVGTIGLFDSSEKQRAPSWCDRILYRTRTDKQAFDKKVKEEEESRKKDAEMTSRGIDQDEDVLFSYDPDTDGDDQDQPQGSAGIDYDEYDENDDTQGADVVTKEGFLDHINLDIYASHQRITSSDHKPIISVFTLEYDAVVPELKAKVYAEVARELDRAENEGRPAITVIVDGGGAVDQSVVDFGQVGYLQKASCSLTIANTGGVAASFSFVEGRNAEEDGESTPNEWLKAIFQRAGESEELELLGKTVMLEPGETVLGVIEAQVSAITHLRALNDNSAKLDEVLVLRVEDGRDHFIPVRAAWQPTCFGRSIDELIRVPDGGIRKFLQDESISGAVPYDKPVHCSAPKELFKLTEALQTLAERCVADETMLEEMVFPRDVGWPLDAATWTQPASELEAIQPEVIAALDTDKPILEAVPLELPSSFKLEIVSSVLLLFLASLTDGLIPPHLWAKLTSTLPGLSALPAQAWPDTRIQVLDVLSAAPNHNIAFVFLTATLAKIITELSPDATSSPTSPRGGAIVRRLSFRRGGADGEATRKKRAREKRYAEVVGPLACRAAEKDKGTRERERVVIEMFLRRDEDG